MANLTYSQTGITADVLEDLRRRQRERGRPAPYAPSMTGLTEPATERAITLAQTSDQDAGDAVREVRERANERVFKSSGPAPGPDLDAQDRESMERARRRSRAVSVIGAITTAFGDRANDSSRMALIQQAQQANDPAQYQANIDARAQQANEDAEAKRLAGIEEEERALNTDYRRTLMRSMDVNADRRGFEMARRTDADARLYDPAHPVAMQRREFLRRIMASAPGLARGFEGQDLDALGSADLRNVADQMLRRIGQIPARYRQTDIDALTRIAQDLDAGDAPQAQPEAAPPAVEAAQALRARRTGVRPAATPGAPAAPAEPAAPVAAPRRDRTVQQIVADRIMERRGQAPPSGYSANDLTPGEAAIIARDATRSGNRGRMARIAGGIDTESREAQFQQPTQQGVFTNRELDNAAEVLAPAASQRRQIAALARQVRGMSQEQFSAAMSNNALLQRAFNAEQFTAAFRALTNSQLREQSGAAVTDQEAQRFFSALSAGQLNSPQAFLSALMRMDREIASNVNGLVRPDIRAAWVARQRGGR
jgi:hypothetical protein